MLLLFCFKNTLCTVLPWPLAHCAMIFASLTCSPLPQLNGKSLEVKVWVIVTAVFSVPSRVLGSS